MKKASELWKYVSMRGLKPTPKTSVSMWADNYRVLSSTSAEPGRWRTSRAPYQKDIMDAFTQPGIHRVVVKSCSQVGKSDIMNNVIGRFAHLDPCTIMMIQPTIEMAQDFSKTRIAPMIRDTPALSSLFLDVKTRDSNNTILNKIFPGGRLVMAGANSPAGLTVSPRLQFKTLGMSVDEAKEWERETAREFDLWAGSTQCDLYRRNNFYDLQNIAYTTYLTDGDSFALFRRKAPSAYMPYSLRIQLIEANRVSNPLGAGVMGYPGPFAVEMRAPNGNRIIDGVEITEDGEITAYWISSKVPYDPTDYAPTTWSRVEAFGKRTGAPNILQICHDIRAEQYRGVPYLAPVLETLKQVSRYTRAELTSAIIKSFFALFFTSSAAGQDLNSILGPQDPNEPVVDVGEYGLAAGTMNALPRGVDVKSVDASNSQSTFEPFVTQLIKQISAAIGQPYEVLLKSFTSSYSASRAALLQAWEEYKLRRRWFANDFCQPIYEAWLAEAIAIGRIDAPGFFEDPRIRQAYCHADWFGPTMSILDPVKDVKGSAMRVAYGLSTRTKEAAEMTSTDFDENIETLAYEQKRQDALGLKFSAPEVLAGKEGETSE